MKDSNTRKMNTNLIYRMKLKVEDQVEGFESPSYEFESLISAQFKFYKKDSNSRVTNSNPHSVDALNA